jgi:ferrochelatase
MPWLEPDINDHLRELHEEGTRSVVVVPIGFTSDHMEVIFDLDTEAAETARGLGMEFVRVATPGTHPDFVAMIRELVLERAAVERSEVFERCALGSLGPHHDVCPVDCCANPRALLPTIS